MESVRHLLLDQVLPRLCAHFFGHPVLHASCASIDRYKVCFLGDSGAGKSTIATAFSRSGGTLISDDCIQLSFKYGSLMGTPNYRGIRLLPDSIEAFENSTPDALKPVAHYTKKKRLILPHEILTAVPITAIFLLAKPEEATPGTQTRILNISKVAAVKKLLKHSLVLDVNDCTYLAKQFEQLTNITKSNTPFYLLNYPKSYKLLPSIVETILQFLQKQSFPKCNLK